MNEKKELDNYYKYYNDIIALDCIALCDEEAFKMAKLVYYWLDHGDSKDEFTIYRDKLQKAFERFVIQADEGNTHAQHVLGHWYQEALGYIVKHDDAMSIKYYTLAADEGYVKSQTALGCVYHRLKRLDLSIHYFNLAIEQGCNEAMFCLGFLYETQSFVYDMNDKSRRTRQIKNFDSYAVAKNYYELAEKNGNKEAKIKLVECDTILCLENNKVIVDIKQKYNQILVSDGISFFKPSNFPKETTLDNIITQAFSNGTRTMQALRELEYITNEGKLTLNAPLAFKVAFENYVGNKAIDFEESSILFFRCG